MAAARRRPAARKELIGPPCPAAAEYVWGLYLQLDAGRGGSFGPEPLSWLELDAFSRLRGMRLSSFELDCIRALDRAWLESKSEAAKPAGRRKR